MDFRHIYKVLAAAVLTVLSCACKKDPEDTRRYLDNSPYFTAENFVNVGDKLVFTPDKVTAGHDESIEVKYAWTVSSLKTKPDTSAFADGHFEYTFSKDTLGTFTVTCSAFATNSTDYYSSAASVALTIVKPGLFDGSIDGIGRSTDMVTFTDDREGQPRGDIEYYAMPVNGKLWMAENLAYTTTDSKIGMAYQDCEAMNHVFGRFYSWEEAQTACPSGWHLTTEAEWMDAASAYTSDPLVLTEGWDGVSGSFMVYADFNGEQMWEWWPEVNATNKSYLCVLPVGWCYLPDKAFAGVTKKAAFWTSAEEGEKGVYRYMTDDQPIIYRGLSDKKSFGASVRCVQD